MLPILQTFQNIFLHENCCIHCTEICSQYSKYKFATIGSDNGLVPNRQQAIIWTNDGLVNWNIYASQSLEELSAILVQANMFFTTKPALS